MKTMHPFHPYFRLRLSILAAVLLLCTGRNAFAAVLMQHLTFTPPFEIADTSSGNHIDRSFRHEIFPANGFGVNDITGVRLGLLHVGNLNEGPTQEIWSLVNAQGSVLATLSNSASVTLWEEWVWPLSEIGFDPLKNTFFADIRISERTSFNGERFEIRESKLTFDFSDPKKEAAVTPEPATAFLLFPLLLGKMVRRFGINGRKRMRSKS